MISLTQADMQAMFDHARAEHPRECCGLLGSIDGRCVSSVYRTENVAAHPLTAYEVAPEALFEAQRLMRAKGEDLFGIYHSHPAQADPLPSETDTRLAYYPKAAYLIIGLDARQQPTLCAFKLIESEARWEVVPYFVVQGVAV
jgi:[CysO sulfur-carrier protein]-S-L-cysteine hydrolase